MTTWDPDGDGPGSPLLVVGGDFTHIDGVPAENVAAWDGRSWFALGQGLPDGIGFGTAVVSALEVYKGELYAGGYLASSPGSLARFDGSAWHYMGLAGLSVVADLFVFDGQLLAGGDVAVAAWNGVEWSNPYPFPCIPFGGCGPSVTALGSLGGQLVAAGTAGSVGFPSAMTLHRWNGAEWEWDNSLPQMCENSRILVFENYNRSLIGAGSFGPAPDSIAAWDGTKWSGLDGGVPGCSPVLTLAEYDGELIVGGHFGQVGGFPGIQCNFIARWDGRDWHTFGSGANGPVTALARHGDELFAAGSFEIMDGVVVMGLARWTSQCDAADLNEDGNVDGFDLALLLGQWTGAGSYAPCPPHGPADLNSDCKINGFDLALLLGAWG